MHAERDPKCLEMLDNLKRRIELRFDFSDRDGEPLACKRIFMLRRTQAKLP
jgi:hypothetical protein